MTVDDFSRKMNELADGRKRLKDAVRCPECGGSGVVKKPTDYGNPYRSRYDWVDRPCWFCKELGYVERERADWWKAQAEAAARLPGTLRRLATWLGRVLGLRR